jgi:REP element-mobilizing transposase RayT
MHPLQPDTSYHIFNHANGFENIFRHEANYWFFMEKYWKYIGPVAETYAWCLMPNHFHLVVRIRKLNDNFSKVSSIDKAIPMNSGINYKSKCNNFGKVLSPGDRELEKYISKQFANLFSCYTQSFNKVYGRMGSLFIKNFKREPILDKTQFVNSIIYTHRNPVHHKFCKQYEDWPYSSYLDIINRSEDKIETGKLLRMMGGMDNFVSLHQRSLENLDFYNDIPILP